jgi:hypothetical protein
MTSHSDQTHNVVNQPSVIPNTLTIDQPTLIKTPQRNVEQGLLDLANTLAQQISLSRLSPPEPSVSVEIPRMENCISIAYRATTNTTF